MDVVRELRRKQDALRSDRPLLFERLAEVDKQVAALDTVIQIWEPDHFPTKAVARRRGKSEKFLDGLFEGENFAALILDTLRLRLYVPETGRIMIDGVDLAMVDVSWLRRQLGVVLQENVLFNRSIRDNIALADSGMPMESVIAAAQLAGAHDFILDQNPRHAAARRIERMPYMRSTI